MKTLDERKVKVLYIAGNGRSGSTILDIILGQLDRFFAVGELRRVWDRGLIENRTCGCDVPFRNCHTWNAIFSEAYGGLDKIDPGRMANYRERFTQTKHLVRMLLHQHQKSLNKDLRAFIGSLEKLYCAIQRVTNCSVIVDSSKWPMYGHLIDWIPSVQLYVVHLVRDPRAVAFSWKRKKEIEPNINIMRQSALRSTAYWLAWNPAITYFWDHAQAKYLLLPYERFICSPRNTITEIVNFVEEDKPELQFIGQNTVDLHRTHAVAGNIARLTRGPVALKLDNEWETEMSGVSKHLVSILTRPLLKKYGYSNAATVGGLRQ